MCAGYTGVELFDISMSKVSNCECRVSGKSSLERGFFTQLALKLVYFCLTYSSHSDMIVTQTIRLGNTGTWFCSFHFVIVQQLINSNMASIL